MFFLLLFFVQVALWAFGVKIAHTNVIVNMTVSVINLTASVNVQKATLVTNVNSNVRAIIMV